MTVTAIPQPVTPEVTPEPARKSRKKLLLVLALVIAGAAAAWWFVLRPAPEGPPQPGEVVELESIQVNLAAAHYLRVGLSLQLVEGAHEVDGSKALDAAIATFSGRSMAQVNDPAGREKLKAALEKRLGELYEHEVMGVYFTEFVTQ